MPEEYSLEWIAYSLTADGYEAALRLQQHDDQIGFSAKQVKAANRSLFVASMAILTGGSIALGSWLNYSLNKERVTTQQEMVAFVMDATHKEVARELTEVRAEAMQSVREELAEVRAEAVQSVREELAEVRAEAVESVRAGLIKLNAENVGGVKGGVPVIASPSVSNDQP